MFRLLVVFFAVVGLFSLFGGAGAIGLSALLFLPILLLKVAFFVMLLGFIGRVMCGAGNRWEAPRWEAPRRARPERQPSGEERFDEWHRMAHAREEVDSWVEHLPGTEPE